MEKEKAITEAAAGLPVSDEAPSRFATQIN
jgi:hypothetical protein